MDFNKEKIIRIMIVASISLSLMLTGQWIYSKYTVEKSLVNTILKKPYVEEVDIKKERTKITVFLKFKDIDNLMWVYNDVYDTIDNHLKGRPFSVKILSQPDRLIEELYSERIQFIIFEALQTGNYTEMKDKLDDIRSRENVDIKVFLDTRNLYLQIKHGEHRFYDVVKRTEVLGGEK